MLYFLGLVTDKDMQNGDLTPSFVLCKSSILLTNTRTGFFIVKRGSNRERMERVVVNNINDKDAQALVAYMSNFRTRDHMHGSTRFKHKDTLKYTPKGALFWFECDEYGDRTGPALFIKMFPDKSYPIEDKINLLRSFQENQDDLLENLSVAPGFVKSSFGDKTIELPLTCGEVRKRKGSTNVCLQETETT